MPNLMILGSGAIATELIDRLPDWLRVSTIVSSSRSLSQVAAAYPEVEVVSQIADVTITPDFVVECAGHVGLKQHGCEVLKRGWSLGIISTGALAETTFYQSLINTAYENNAQLHIISGAIAGLDGLSAACEHHSEAHPVRVTYVSTKSPKSWAGTYAEELVNLNTLSERTLFFESTAREAARLFPQNANVAATIALKGVGFEATKVQLSVDPNITKNKHTIHVQGEFGDITIEILGNTLPNNPKTSYLTALSVLNVCKNAVRRPRSSR